jgi:hypothetical protein
MNFSCKEPVEPLTLDEIADRCHCPDEVLFLSLLVYVKFHILGWDLNDSGSN